MAIADVAHYVAPGSALDREARLRGNSVYFPDRVVPMLPEALSDRLVQPAARRGSALPVRRDAIDAEGRKTAHRFGRGLMRSAARLTYEAVQDAAERATGSGSAMCWRRCMAPFAPCLRPGARAARSISICPSGRCCCDDGVVTEIRLRARLDSHRLVEEFMILANVAAAETLERQHSPCMYRIHAPPSEEKLEALRTFLHGLGIGLPAGNQVHPRDLERVLQRVAGTPEAALVNEIILRSQSQAEYSPDNIGHFGLALPRYAHFTSPIRRYADLLVHRALIVGLSVRAGPVPGRWRRGDGRHITATERRAAQAERDALDRYLAAFLASRVGETFPARVSGVQRFGIFATLRENGATGLIAISGLPGDVWLYDPTTQTLSGRSSKMIFRLAQDIDVRLLEANALTGGLAVRYPGNGERDAAPLMRSALVFLLLIFTGPSWSAPPAPKERFGAEMAARCSPPHSSSSRRARSRW